MPLTLAHNVTTPAEVPAVLDLARDPVRRPRARSRGSGVGSTGYFADPDGFRWEVARNPGPIGLRVVPDTEVDGPPVTVDAHGARGGSDALRGLCALCASRGVLLGAGAPGSGVLVMVRR